MAMALQSEASNTSTDRSRALAHVLWSVATEVRRKHDTGVMRVQLTIPYIITGASVTAYTAAWALSTFLRRTGSDDQPRHGNHGWFTLRPDVLASTWIAYEWCNDHGLVHEPAVRPITFVPLFGIDPEGETKGKCRCGCPAHSNGDRDPSLLFNLGTHRATCLVTRKVYALISGPEGWSACDLPELGKHMTRYATSVEPVEFEESVKGVPPTTGCAGGSDLPEDMAGSPSAPPTVFGMVTGRLWTTGINPKLSGSSSREGWARWTASRYGGASGKAAADRGMIKFETSPNPTHVRGYCPDRLVGVGWWARVPDSFRWMGGGKPGAKVWPVWDYAECGTGHVLIDMDDCGPLPDGKGVDDFVIRIREAIEGRGLFGVVTWIVRTSHAGVQVLVRLRQFRRDVAGFYAHPAVRQRLAEVGGRVAEITGGHADPAVWCAGRFCRAPGWRARQKGREVTVEHSELWYVRPSTVPKKPRKIRKSATATTITSTEAVKFSHL